MRRISGTHGWIALGAGIVAWEALAPELLSEAVDRALLHPRHKWWVRAGIILTAAHLLNILPSWIDPWHGMGKIVDRVRVRG